MPSPVLFVIPNVPHPIRTGGHLRDWQILNLLARIGVRPAVLYFRAGESYDLAAASPIAPLVGSVRCAGARAERPDRSRAATLRRKLGYLHGALAPRDRPSFPFSYQYDAVAVERAVLAEAERTEAEVVILRSFLCHLGPSLKRTGRRVIANCPDDNTALAWEMVKGSRGLLGRLGPLCNYIGTRRQERTHLPGCDEVWIPTHAEQRALGRFVPRDRLRWLPNLMDVESVPDLSGCRGERGEMLFVANFAYLPNQNAADLLLRTIFPEVRRRIPHARLHLVGGGMPDRLRHLASEAPGVLAPGSVESVEPWYRRAEIVLLPVSEGAGMLYKAIEALAYGKPVVGLRRALRGLEEDASGPPPFISVGSPGELIEQATQLLGDATARARLGTHARRFARRRMSWDLGVRLLEGSLVSRFGRIGERTSAHG